MSSAPGGHVLSSASGAANKSLASAAAWLKNASVAANSLAVGDGVARDGDVLAMI